MQNMNLSTTQRSPRVLVATPSYDHNVTHAYSAALAEMCCYMRAKNISVNSSLLVASSLLCKTRNTILSMFLQSDATHLMCIDADIGWPPDVVEVMLSFDKDIVCGVYPARDDKKDGKNTYIFVPELDADNMCVTDNHLLKALYVPAGFMLIKREAIERMIAKFPERYVESISNSNVGFDRMYVFFNTEIHDGKFWGEDYTFCRLAREAGNEIWVDPHIPLNHAGKVGKLVDELTSGNSKEEVAQKLKLVSQNKTNQQLTAPEAEELTFNIKRG